MNTLPAVVLDCGSASCKVGMADHKYPKHTFPSIVGRYRNPSAYPPENRKDAFVGHAAQSRREILSVKYPIECGIITNWDDIEWLWDSTFRDVLEVTPNERTVILTEPPAVPKANREKMTQVMFETFDVPCLYIGNEATLSLMATGHVTGLVLTSGQSVSHMISVYEGYKLPHTLSHFDNGGDDLTYKLRKLLGNTVEATPLDVIREIKEKLCYVASDFDKELESCKTSVANEEYYTLPDGRTLSLKEERFKCPEVYFKPQLIGQEMPGIHEMLFHTVLRTDQVIHKYLLSHLLLCGGSTMFPGMGERMVNELRQQFQEPMPVSLCAHAESDRKHLCWMGGALVASTSGFSEMLMTKEEYDEFGPALVHNKCF